MINNTSYQNQQIILNNNITSTHHESLKRESLTQHKSRLHAIKLSITNTKDNYTRITIKSRLSGQHMGEMVLYRQNAHDCLLLKIMINKSYREHGVGSKAMKQLLHLATLLKFKKLYLAAEPLEKEGIKTFGQEAKARRRLMAFYSRFGAIRVENSYNEMFFNIQEKSSDKVKLVDIKS